jgi:ribosome recycling factor
MKEARLALGRAVRHFADQILIGSGVISPGVLDTVRVAHDGGKSPLSRLAVTAWDQGRVTVQPHDPRMLGRINQALQQAGFRSFLFSKTQVVVPFCPLSGEERARVIAHVNRLAEEARVAVRNVRKKVRQKLDRVERKDLERALQELTDDAIGRIEALKEGKLRSL